MTRFSEGYLAFEFGPRWQVIKLDDHPDYRNRLEKQAGAKAVDFLAVFDKRELYLIEVKDFRRDRIATKERLLRGELAIELAKKVRDSLACIIGAYRTSSRPEEWQPYATLLCNPKRRIKVVLWLEYELPPHPPARKKVMFSVRANMFKRRLAWLTPQLFVFNLDNPGLLDVKVSNLPRP
ncbi:MAG: hypothetical protein ACPGWR_27305 [Ardenticatenaceae bacterium]